MERSLNEKLWRTERLVEVGLRKASTKQPNPIQSAFRRALDNKHAADHSS